MPIFEYRCQACDHRFEALVFGGKTPDCPECGARKLEKLFSAFAVGHGNGGVPPSCPAPAGGG